MDAATKSKIKYMRQAGQGYTAIARVLDMPVNTVKTYCRRTGLTGIQGSKNYPDVDLISVPDGVINSMRAVSNHPVRKAITQRSAECTVTVSYADKQDDTAISDVLSMLMNTNLKG